MYLVQIWSQLGSRTLHHAVLIQYNDYDAEIERLKKEFDGYLITVHEVGVVAS